MYTACTVSEEVWCIDSFWAFDERKFGELIDQPIGYKMYVLSWFGESWMIHQICQTSSPIKLSRYMDVYVCICIPYLYWLKVFWIIINKCLGGKVLQSITFLWPFRKNLVNKFTLKSFFPTPKICHNKFDPVFDITLGTEGIKFVGLSLAVEILYTFQPPPKPGGWWWLIVLSVGCSWLGNAARGSVMSSWWVNNVNVF